MTQRERNDTEQPVVYEDDLDELAHLVLNNPDHPRAKEIKRIAQKLEKENLSELSN